jgi:hypothetical protein
MKAVSFTGHRPERLGGYDRHHPTNQIVRNWLREVIQRLQKEGYEEFICGGALGIDQWAADIILELGFKLVLAIPYEDYGSNWPDESQKCLAEQRAKASRVVMVCKGGYFDENGNTLEGLNEPDVPEKLKEIGGIKVVYYPALHASSRSDRCGEACSELEAAIDALNTWLDEIKSEAEGVEFPGMY